MYCIKKLMSGGLAHEAGEVAGSWVVVEGAEGWVWSFRIDVQAVEGGAIGKAQVSVGAQDE